MFFCSWEEKFFWSVDSIFVREIRINRADSWKVVCAVREIVSAHEKADVLGEPPHCKAGDHGKQAEARTGNQEEEAAEAWSTAARFGGTRGRQHDDDAGSESLLREALAAPVHARYPRSVEAHSTRVARTCSFFG